jgi:transposase
MRPPGSPPELEARRRAAVRLVLDEGLSKAEAGRRVGAHRNSVALWVKAHAAGGEQALAVRPPGPAPRLTPARRDQLVGWLLEGARAQGFSTDLWTLPRVAALIRRRWGVPLHPDHLSRLLRAWGLSWQKPRHRPRERDQAAVDRWLARDWPRIKKKPAASGPTWSSSTRPATS